MPGLVITRRVVECGNQLTGRALAQRKRKRNRTLPAIPVNALVVDDHDDQTVYAATDIGVFVTRDGGASWQDFTGGYLPGLRLPRVVVSGLGPDRTSRRLFASTIGWRVLPSVVTGDWRNRSGTEFLPSDVAKSIFDQS